MSPCKYLDQGQPLKAQYPMGNAVADSPGANILPGNSLLVLFQLAVGDITANTASCYLKCLSYLLFFFFFLTCFNSLPVFLSLFREIVQEDEDIVTPN